MHQFDNNHGKDSQKLNKYITNGEIKEARSLSHNLKGVAGTLGLLSIHETTKALEEKFHNQSNIIEDDEIQSLMTVLTTELEIVHQVLSSIGKQEYHGKTFNINPEEIKKILDHIKALLEEDDTSANAVFMESEQLLHQSFGVLLVEFKQHIESFDYQSALISLESLSKISIPFDVTDN